MKNSIVNINGKFFAGKDAKIEIFDRGFLYGDSLYEVLRTYQGKPYGIAEHLDRLFASAELCHITLGQTRSLYTDEILKTLQEFSNDPKNKGLEAYCRIIVTRGAGKIGFGIQCVETPTQYVIIVQPLEPPSDEQFKKGLKLQISPRLRNDRRALDPAMKSGNYLNSVLAYLEAQSLGYDDALLCNYDAHITEGTTFNIFYIKRDIVVTPPLEIGILDGITRRKTLEIARLFNLKTIETRFPKERLLEADEVFVTSSIKEVFPVTQLDQHKIHSAKPGKFTIKLASEFKKWTLSTGALK